jgi:hypothetical protein
MFKKLTAILMPLVLAPLGLLLTPAIARADYTYRTRRQICSFSSGGADKVAWTAEVSVRSRDNAARITRIMFGSDDQDPRIRIFIFWESRVVWYRRMAERVETRYSQQTYNFIPTVYTWDSLLRYEVLPTTWISTLGNRYINVWFYDSSGRICKDRIEF